MKINKKKTKNIPKPTHFGKNLKFLRRMKGMSQTALAAEIGLSRNNIASYESGIVEPNSKNFLSTCIYFGIDPKDMLEIILSEHPVEVTSADDRPDTLVGQQLNDQMEQFVIQTNEMTKVLEGYQVFFAMKSDSDTYTNNRELYSTLEDLLELLNSLVRSNWNLIQSVYPDHDKT